MKRMLRYLCIAVGVVIALVIVGFTGLYFLGTHVIADRRTACMASDDFVAVRSNLEAALKAGTIDQPVMDRENRTIASAQEACALGDKDKARSLLVDVMMDTALQSDDVYARKVNAEQDKKEPPAK